MNPDNSKLRDILAAQYVLGTLRGPARKRFEALKLKHADWQHAVNWWTTRLHLIADTIPATEPRREVWQKIESRLFAKPLAATSVNNAANNAWWQQLNWWRGLTIGSSSIAAVLAILMLTSPPETITPPVEVAVKAPVETTTQVALLANEKATPGWILALTKNTTGQTELRVTALASLTQAKNNSFELWILPADQSAPISLGLLPQQGNQQVVVNEKTAELLLKSGLAVSLEPTGGSPTGQPTGAVLYQGKLTQI